MNAALLETAPAKINLTLRVLGRRADGYHELESLVAFADLADELRLDPGSITALEISGAFGTACGAASDNLVLKAAGAAALPAGLFSLDKHIPVAAGLGGGSADAAAALRLIARANGLPLDDPRLLAAARTAGSDVPVCLHSRARMMRGTGEMLSEPLALPKLPALLVNPRVTLSTGQVFAAFAAEGAQAERIGDIPSERGPLLAWLAARSNDLTHAATALAPVISDVLHSLEALPGCRVARMSGSGASCFGLFESAEETAAAAKQLAIARGNWWIRPTMLG